MKDAMYGDWRGGAFDEALDDGEIRCGDDMIWIVSFQWAGRVRFYANALPHPKFPFFLKLPHRQSGRRLPHLKASTIYLFIVSSRSSSSLETTTSNGGRSLTT
jgi:hypothetical protein